MLDWFRFVLTAVLMLAGLFVLLVGVVSQYRFRYVLNRMHAASMGDSLGMLLCSPACAFPRTTAGSS